MNLTPHERVQRAHIQIMREVTTCAYGPVCLIGSTRVTAEVMTAATDGLNKMYNPEFVAKQSDAQLRGLIVHEALHVMKQDLRLYKDLRQEDAELANQAIDYANNLLIVDCKPFLDLPDGGCYDERFRGMHARQVFDILKKEKPPEDNPKPKQGQPQPGQGQPMGSHDWEAAEKMTDAQAEVQAKSVEQAVRQGIYLSKKLHGTAPKALEDMVEPQVDWAAQFRDWLSQRMQGSEHSTWARPNRRFIASGCYMPSTYDERIDRLGLFIDTSGSIGPRELTNALSEVAAAIDALHPASLDIIYWDTRVAVHEHYEDPEGSQVLASTRPKGGGGTTPSCVPRYLQTADVRQPTVAVFISDGQVGNDWAEDLDCPTLWVITPGGRVPPSRITHVCMR